MYKLHCRDSQQTVNHIWVGEKKMATLSNTSM